MSPAGLGSSRLHEDLLCELEAFVHARVLGLDVAGDGHAFDGPRGGHVGDVAGNAANDDLRSIFRENNLNKLVAHPKEQSLSHVLPLPKVDQRLSQGQRPLWSTLRAEGEGERPELLVAVEEALEVLEQDDFLAQALGVIEEVVVLELFPIRGHQGWLVIL